MLCEVPLTKEQQTFATAHHSLVYKFLNENRLPEDEFYDVVIFGYLKAVRDYFSDLTAQQFTFSTIANRRMKFCLFDYFRTQERRKRNMEILSIHVGLYPDGAPLEAVSYTHLTNAIQLGTPFFITIEGDAKLGGFWNLDLVNITVDARGSGVIEHCWK